MSGGLKFGMKVQQRLKVRLQVQPDGFLKDSWLAKSPDPVCVQTQAAKTSDRHDTTPLPRKFTETSKKSLYLKKNTLLHSTSVCHIFSHISVCLCLSVYWKSRIQVAC